MSTILLIDDDPIAQQGFEGILLNEGYQLAFACDGLEGLEQAARLSPDVILLDVMMPGMNGFEVCKRLRANPALAEIPVLLVTALDDRESRLEGLRSGADDFLSKPVDRLELKARLQTITRLNRYRKLNDERMRLEQAHRELQQAYESTLVGWTHALDLRDRETEHHTERVTIMTLRLAQAYGLPDEQLVHIRRGALLHDIGKIGIPDYILHKPGALNEEEWAIMRKHPVYAYSMIYPIEYLRPSLDIPYCHHEKWDGSGYPQGLKGEAIPLAARLFAIVDVWDALTSDRPYRAAWPAEKVRAHILEQSGRHFDPRVVEVFLKEIS